MLNSRQGEKQTSTGMEREGAKKGKGGLPLQGLAAIISAETTSKIPNLLFSESQQKHHKVARERRRNYSTHFTTQIKAQEGKTIHTTSEESRMGDAELLPTNIAQKTRTAG